MSYYTPYKIGVYGSVSPSSGQKGKRAEPPKVRTGQKQKVSAFSCHLLLDLCHFLRKGVSRDAERKGEVQNGLTSCLARQTGSASIFLPVNDWIVPFSPKGGFSGCWTLWWSRKCRHFLFCSPNRKCQHFPVRNWFICAVFSGRGFLGITNTMTKLKMMSLPVLLAKQEVPAFSCL